ncbi:MAG: hypothetical protein A3C50_03020 [Candidatus Staskawiczbacteria bacterium RIFCSPHIGHO2_02_FULL_43_16]|uniref:Uncharacterized protein n=1 Tax=Candidatus Staskawiczbacteria bacterium RIFCSPHIGHO2_01_FULL_41_41 TaxID=1802203 RepID=A0A1G2HRW9_9BACT|nr:MAG: hypothetical protein A2822_01075 [Candidatus Staskawiczbacteria bacterium RIFCSPHIGHO2_01_FULL_41_41]OGZ68587.1 MAG: hypothetical protein A3C50_03020 [Candidatus Staskawiczbacteria bacterium RIFCSPHIGHO2_02_FULL_43_16]
MEEEIIPIPLQISVHETIYVSEWLVVGVIVGRITTWDFNPKSSETIVSVAEYRKILGDTTSTDKSITKRLQFLEAFCRNIIKLELQTYEQ